MVIITGLGDGAGADRRVCADPAGGLCHGCGFVRESREILFHGAGGVVDPSVRGAAVYSVFRRAGESVGAFPVDAAGLVAGVFHRVVIGHAAGDDALRGGGQRGFQARDEFHAAAGRDGQHGRHRALRMRGGDVRGAGDGRAAGIRRPVLHRGGRASNQHRRGGHSLRQPGGDPADPEELRHPRRGNGGGRAAGGGPPAGHEPHGGEHLQRLLRGGGRREVRGRDIAVESRESVTPARRSGGWVVRRAGGAGGRCRRRRWRPGRGWRRRWRRRVSGGSCGSAMQAAFGGVAEVAAFDQDAGDFRIAGEAQAAADESAVASFPPGWRQSMARCRRTARPWLSTRQ